jgi:putative intracellular protease/amidase
MHGSVTCCGDALFSAPDPDVEMALKLAVIGARRHWPPPSRRGAGRWCCCAAVGKSLFKGRRLTAFTDAEEQQVGLAANAPWLLEKRLRDAGAVYESGPAWQPFVVVDGNLSTGQDPASGSAAAQAMRERQSAVVVNGNRLAIGRRAAWARADLSRSG